MRRGIIACTALVLLAAGCGTGTNTSYDSETLASYHMERADSLEAVSMLRDAAFEYKLVAELYPKTSQYPKAVRNTALLYSNPANPALDDSLALQWFRKYLALPIAREERTKAEIYVTMLERLTSLRKEIARRNSAIDSLQTVARKQAGELSGRTRKIQDLETDLRQANIELERLREVDVRINRRKGGK